MPKASWSDEVYQRVRGLLEIILLYDAEGRNDLKLKCTWQDENTDRPKLVVDTKRRFLDQLGNFDKNYYFNEAKSRLQDLGIFEDKRIHKRGTEEWRFALKLWSRDKETNIIEFDKAWEYRRPKKSKKINNKKYNQDKVSLDFERLIRSNIGLFGNSRLDTSLMARLLFSVIIRQHLAVNLIFDLHSEYGWESVSQAIPLRRVKGLQQIFPDDVEIYTLDLVSARRRGVPAHEFYLSYDQIEVEDIELVRQELGLSQDNLNNANILYSEFGKSWIIQLLNMSNEEIQIFCHQKRGNKTSIMELQGKLLSLDNCKYMRAACPENYIIKVLQTLEKGKSVVLEFGFTSDILSYKLIANMIVRRIQWHYVRKIEKYLGTNNLSNHLHHLVITIEDASYLLNPDTVHHNIFKSIAKESRKYGITLLVLEQYPSKIDREVMHQLDNRIAYLLDSEDVNAILTGISASKNLRSVLCNLDSTQQAVIFGREVPTPVLIKMRPWDENCDVEIGKDSWEDLLDIKKIC